MTELRRRKARADKALAVMVADVGEAEGLCEISEAEKELLCSWRRPIVLLRRRVVGSDATHHLEPESRNPILARGIAPGNPFLGLMLPYTPLHHLLLRAISPLVMTSGNRRDEPIATEEAGAFETLRGIADLFLTHNRPIHVRCDDSVTRIIGGVESPVRRSRGYAPRPIKIGFRDSGFGIGEGFPSESRNPNPGTRIPILAVGGQMKNTFALLRTNEAILSHHIGDLDHWSAIQMFERDVALYEKLFELHPAAIAHDLHPDYASTRYAVRRGEREGIPLIAVQHHHAHLAACLAEHEVRGPAIGVIWDGTGYGLDGAIWGGEFLIGDLSGFRRAAHLRYVGLPGGEAAVRRPWRMALSHLLDAGVECPAFESRLDAMEVKAVRRMLERGLNSPATSSMGRLFDAVAALAGVRDVVSFEGQAAMELEWAATGEGECGTYPFEVIRQETEGAKKGVLALDARPLIRAVAADVGRGASAGVIARRFHSTLVEMIAAVCGRLREETGINTVALSGGVFMNALLAVEAADRLEKEHFLPLRHRRVPPNDGGLSLGQIAVAGALGVLQHTISH